MLKTVYIAGPYTVGDIDKNVKRAINAADELSKHKIIPYIPHLFHYWDKEHPHDYDFWMLNGIQWMLRCDYVLRIEGDSKGADKEVRIAKLHRIPVFYDIDELISYVKSEYQKKEAEQMKASFNAEGIEIFDDKLSEVEKFLEKDFLSNSIYFNVL